MENQQLLPSHASWESTLRCPLRCKHCGLDAGDSRPQELSTAESKRMLSTLNKFGIDHLIISGGEFTYREDWREIISFALPLFKTIRIITSGWLGKKLFAELGKIKETDNLIISVSLDGLKERHDSRRGAGSFAKVLETMQYDSYIPKTVLTTVDNLNIHDCLDVLKLCLELNINSWSIQISLPAGRMKSELFLGQEKIIILAEAIVSWQKKFDNRIEILPDDCFANLISARQQKPWNGCRAGKDLITILNDGSITGCPTMGIIGAGNIKTDSLEKIWNSKTMENLRQGKPSECLTCNKCPGGCKAISQLFNQQFCLTI
jgi:radical SAM protein with 4Fe4S-binding SPASM domain